jgi:hypothetical protein
VSIYDDKGALSWRKKRYFKYFSTFFFFFVCVSKKIGEQEPRMKLTISHEIVDVGAILANGGVIQF